MFEDSPAGSAGNLVWVAAVLLMAACGGLGALSGLGGLPFPVVAWVSTCPGSVCGQELGRCGLAVLAGSTTATFFGYGFAFEEEFATPDSPRFAAFKRAVEAGLSQWAAQAELFGLFHSGWAFGEPEFWVVATAGDVLATDLVCQFGNLRGVVAECAWGAGGLGLNSHCVFSTSCPGMG